MVVDRAVWKQAHTFEITAVDIKDVGLSTGSKESGKDLVHQKMMAF